MEFYERRSLYDWQRHNLGDLVGSREDYKSHAASMVRRLRGEQQIDAYWELTSDYLWDVAGKPYYSVWPSILPALTKVRLDIPGEIIKLPLPQILIRFPKPYGYQVGDFSVRTILAASVVSRATTESDDCLGLAVFCDFGETRTEGGIFGPVYTSTTIPLDSKTIEEALSQANSNTPVQIEEPTDEPIRIAVAIALMASDPDLITADVLAKDRHKLDSPSLTESELQAIIDRAHRRGKKGWEVGRNIEVDPHYRRPYLGLRWTGEGRKVPKIVPVKGCIVKREKAVTVPTGYLGEPAT